MTPTSSRNRDVSFTLTISGWQFAGQEASMRSVPALLMQPRAVMPLRPSSVVRRPSSVVRRPSSVVRRPSSVVRRPSSVACRARVPQPPNDGSSAVSIDFGSRRHMRLPARNVGDGLCPALEHGFTGPGQRAVRSRDPVRVSKPSFNHPTWQLLKTLSAWVNTREAVLNGHVRPSHHRLDNVDVTSKCKA